MGAPLLLAQIEPMLFPYGKFPGWLKPGQDPDGKVYFL